MRGTLSLHALKCTNSLSNLVTSVITSVITFKIKKGVTCHCG